MQWLGLAATCRNATQTHRLLRCILGNRFVVQHIQRRLIVDRTDCHRKRLRHRQIVGSRLQLAVIAAILNRYGNHRRPTLICDRRKFQRAGGIGGCIGDRRSRNQARVTAGNRHLQRLRFPGTGRNASQVHRLLGRILTDREVGRLVEVRCIIHWSDRQREGLAKVAVVRCCIDVPIQTSVLHSHCDCYNPMAVK